MEVDGHKTEAQRHKEEQKDTTGLQQSNTVKACMIFEGKISHSLSPACGLPGAVPDSCCGQRHISSSTSLLSQADSRCDGE